MKNNETPTYGPQPATTTVKAPTKGVTLPISRATFYTGLVCFTLGYVIGMLLIRAQIA